MASVWRKSLGDELGKLGAKVATNIQVKVEQSEYITEVQQIKAAAPDAIFYAGYEVETPYLRNALVKAGVTVPFMASDGAFLSATIDESDGTAKDIYVSSFAPAPSAVADKAWIAAYQAVENRNPETYSINGYSALKALGEAVKKANSIDAKQVDERPARDRSQNPHRPDRLRRKRRPQRSAHLHLPGAEGRRRTRLRASAAVRIWTRIERIVSIEFRIFVGAQCGIDWIRGFSRWMCDM